MLHQCPPWTLRAWPPLLWQVGRRDPLPLLHLGTQITGFGPSPNEPPLRSVGQTIWACHGAQGDVGMAWDWVQLTCGVVAMADPMAVVTNLRLVDSEGEVLSAHASACHFNAMVYGLPWQAAVAQVLSGAAGG